MDAAKTQALKREPEVIVTNNQRPREEQDEEISEVSTELSLWYGVSMKTKATTKSVTGLLVRNHKRKVLESNTAVVAVTKNKENIGRVTREHEEDSTKLKLYDESWIIKVRDIGDLSDSLGPKSKSIEPINCGVLNLAVEERQEAQRIARQRFQTREDQEEERRLGVSTGLKLYEDPWKIKKKLTQSDIDGSSRLLLGQDLIRTNIIPFLDDYRARVCQTLQGGKVTVLDNDTGTEHQLVLKTWTTGSSVLTSNWKQEFVNRRHLRVHDEIGFFWDRRSSRLYFSLLKKAP